jgi:predicted RNA-binding protein YlxR (DUF448 family)
MRMAMGRTAVPERTCVGCRGGGPKAGLLRVTRGAGDAVAVDPSGGAPGRGAYVHRDAECVAAAFRRGGLAKALRTALGGARAASLRREIEEELQA